MSALTRRDDHINLIFQTFYGVETIRDDVSPSYIAALTIRDDGTLNKHFIAQCTLRDCYRGEEILSGLPEFLREKYTNISFFKSSGESCLWRAKSLEDASSSIIKVYRNGISSDSEVLDRLSHAKHPNIVSIKEWGITDQKTFEVMEFVSDVTLSDMIKSFPLSEAQCVELLKNITDALESLSSSEIIHADVKPDNILRSEDGWKLCDFGISAISDADGNAARHGQTSMYAAPEVGSGILSTASDFWSLGMVIFHSLTHEIDPLNWGEHNSFHHSWQDLINGLLSNDIANRWGIEQIRYWLNSLNKTDLKTTQQHESLKELAREIALRWYEMTSMVRNGSFAEWIETRLGDAENEIKLNAYQPNENADLYILRTLFLLDPDITPVWKEWAISENNLSLMAQNALNNDSTYLQVVGEIYRLDILHEVLLHNKMVELQQPRTLWRESVEGYFSAQEWMMRYVSDTTFEDDKNISLLYLNRNDGMNTIPWDTAYDWCYLWIGHLINEGQNNRGTNLVAALAANRFRGTMYNHLDISLLEPLEGIENTEQFHLFKNAPIIAMRADPIPIQYCICQEEIAIGRRVRISWDISGALWCYFSATGKVEAQGWVELAIGDTTHFTLYAVSWIGYAQASVVVPLDERPVLTETVNLEPISGDVMELPVMEVAQESLSPPVTLIEEEVLKQRDLPNPVTLNREVLVLNEPLELNNQSTEERS